MVNTQTLTYRRAVYDVYATLHDNLPADHPGIELTPDVCNTVAVEARRLIRARTFRGKVGRRLLQANPHWVTGRQVHKWLSAPGRFSPYVDRVVVARALQFDPESIAVLTELEREAFYRSLAAMDDPYSNGRDLIDDIMREHGDSKFLERRPKSLRREAWLALSVELRDAITHGVARTREALREAAEARPADELVAA